MKNSSKAVKNSKNVAALAPVPPPSQATTGWKPRFEQSGTEPGESLGAAVRRQVAWIVLMREQLDHGADPVDVGRDLDDAASTLATLSLEVDALQDEVEAAAARVLASAVTS